MSLETVLDIAYASLIEDFSPPLSRLAAREQVEAVLADPVDEDPEEWGTDPESQRALHGMLNMRARS